MRQDGPRHWLGRVSDYLAPDGSEHHTPAPDIDVRFIPMLPADGWRMYSVEDMQMAGAAPKGYLVYGHIDDPRAVAYIAKQPGKYGHRECVTEYMISRIGRTLPLRLAKSALVRLPTKSGDPDVRFLSRSFLVRNKTSLKHGVELVAEHVGSSQLEMHEVFNLGNKAAETKFYTLETVVGVLTNWGRSVEERRGLLEAFGRMLAFDAIIGAPDRHAENWGVLEYPGQPDAPRRLAPVYDTARGLFVEHREQKFLLNEARGRRDDYIARYAERSRPVFGCADGPEKVNHFQLIEYGVRRFGQTLRGPVSQMLSAYRSDAVEAMLRKEFGRLISPLRMMYVSRLLKYRVTRLQRILKETRKP